MHVCVFDILMYESMKPICILAKERNFNFSKTFRLNERNRRLNRLSDFIKKWVRCMHLNVAFCRQHAIFPAIIFKIGSTEFQLHWGRHISLYCYLFHC